MALGELVVAKAMGIIFADNRDVTPGRDIVLRRTPDLVEDLVEGRWGRPGSAPVQPLNPGVLDPSVPAPFSG